MNDLILLTLLHQLYAAIFVALGWRWLKHPHMWLHSVLLGAAVLWTVASGIALMNDSQGFLGWFFAHFAERNLTAILGSVLLLLVGLWALVAFWRSRAHQALWQRGFWLAVGVLFVFLAIDEYASIHESIPFWREGYAALGALVGLYSLAIAATDRTIRYQMILFAMGLGSMGVGGVYLDAVSNQHTIDVGSFSTPTCHMRGWLGIDCHAYGITEEFFELVGIITMWVTTMSIVRTWAGTAIALGLRRGVSFISGAWLIAIIGWMWLLPAIESQLATPIHVDYGNLELLSYRISSDVVEPEDTLEITVYARTRRFVDVDYGLSLHMLVQEAWSWAQDDQLLGEFVYPTQGWIPFIPVRSRFVIDVPHDIRYPASYYLAAILWQGDFENQIAVTDTDRNTLDDGEIIILQGITAPAQRDTPPVPDMADYRFQNGIVLTAYDYTDSMRCIDENPIGFWWQTERDIDGDYTQFVHFVHQESDSFYTFDRAPFAPVFPTRDWVDGMLVYDQQRIQLPPDAPSGNYAVYSGLYDVYTVERLAVVDSANQPVRDNAIPLGIVRCD